MRLAHLICAGALLLAVPGSALGSVVSVDTFDGWEGEPVLEGWLNYTALVGERNRLRVEQAGDGSLLFTDTGVERIFEDEAGCEQMTPQRVACRPDPFEDVWDLGITLGDGADSALVLSTDFDPEPGGHLPLELDGGSGPDVLRTRVSDVKVYGRGGNDRIDLRDRRSPARTNVFSCGRGRDRAVVDRSFWIDLGDCERLVRRRP